MAKIEKGTFEKIRNDYQQYDVVSIFKAAENRTLRHCNVASLARVERIEKEYIYCTPFPIEEGVQEYTIAAYNINEIEAKKGDVVLVLYADRDFRDNKNDPSSISQSTNTNLHSISYGIVIAPVNKGIIKRVEELEKEIKEIETKGNVSFFKTIFFKGVNETTNTEANFTFSFSSPLSYSTSSTIPFSTFLSLFIQDKVNDVSASGYIMDKDNNMYFIKAVFLNRYRLTFGVYDLVPNNRNIVFTTSNDLRIIQG